MNNLKGKIESFQSEGDLSIVKIGVAENTLSAIVIENPETSKYLEIGKEVNVYFKETEVIIAKNISYEISLENRIPCTVGNVKKGKLLSNVELLLGSEKMNSVISTEAFCSLEIKEGDEVTAMIKMNEIMIAP